MTGEDARRETFGRSVQLRPSAHLKRSLIFKEMIVILSCHGYGGLSFVARRKRKIMPLENGSFFRVSRCNFNKSWISGRARGMRGWKREIVAGGTACEFGIPRAHRCLGLIYRRAVIYTYDLRIFSLSLSPLPFSSVSRTKRSTNGNPSYSILSALRIKIKSLKKEISRIRY